jgi:hypothetical protein
MQDNNHDTMPYVVIRAIDPAEERKQTFSAYVMEIWPTIAPTLMKK